MAVLRSGKRQASTDNPCVCRKEVRRLHCELLPLRSRPSSTMSAPLRTSAAIAPITAACNDNINELCSAALLSPQPSSSISHSFSHRCKSHSQSQNAFHNIIRHALLCRHLHLKTHRNEPRRVVSCSCIGNSRTPTNLLTRNSLLGEQIRFCSVNLTQNWECTRRPQTSCWFLNKSKASAPAEGNLIRHSSFFPSFLQNSNPK
jgi:hypothetical protein